MFDIKCCWIFMWYTYFLSLFFIAIVSFNMSRKYRYKKSQLLWVQTLRTLKSNISARILYLIASLTDIEMYLENIIITGLNWNYKEQEKIEIREISFIWNCNPEVVGSNSTSANFVLLMTISVIWKWLILYTRI